MSNLPQDKNLYDYLSQLSQRIQRLETGGRPIVRNAPVASISIPDLTAGSWASLNGVLSWTSAISANPGGIPYVSVFVDTLDDAYLFPAGASLSSGQRDMDLFVFGNEDDLADYPNDSSASIFIRNNDSSAHTYHIRLRWTYIGGQSSGENS